MFLAILGEGQTAWREEQTKKKEEGRAPDSPEDASLSGVKKLIGEVKEAQKEGTA